MSISSQFPQTSLTDVFKRLAAGLGAGTTVVTPNQRLGLALKNKFDHYQVTQKLVVWESADILPFSAFIERLYQDALYSISVTELPLLLTTFQARALWESVIYRSDKGKLLLAVPQTAKFVHEAWQLAHAWQLFPKLKNFSQNNDGKVFHEWVQCYEQITKRDHQTDDARVCDLVIELYEQLQIKKPKCLVCYGFDTFTPQQISFLEKLVATDCVVMLSQPASRDQPGNGCLQRVTCVDSRDEIYRAAVWARARIEADSTKQIGVVVPELASYRNTIIRIFSSVMTPDVESVLPGATRCIAPFNVSLGIALTDCPLISTLFQVVALVGREIEFERASLLMRSPFLGGGASEMNNRAQLDAQLRKRAEPFVTLERLLVLIKREKGEMSCPLLMRQLSALAEFRQKNLSSLQKPSAWAKLISEILKIAGFPGDRGLDSTEYQTLKKWHEVVANFAALGCVIPLIRYAEALSHLHRLATETLFQPETPDVPIQILGVLEVAGMEFDHLWIMGLSDEVWPLHPRPNPFLPIQLQREAKLPLGSTTESFVHSQQLTDRWLSSADEVILSHPQRSDDRDGHALEPSALIKSIAESELELPAYINHRDLIQRASQLECIVDDKVPKLVTLNNGVSGGAAVIKDYAACPFRAVARHRFKADSLHAPHTGLNAMERGTLMHDVLARSWKQLETKTALDEISDDDLEKLLTRVAKSAIHYIQRDRPTILLGRFAEIEQERLVRLVREWLNAEKKRNPFTVIAIEEKHSIQIGELTLSARLDRVDELEDGSRIVIDYKTQKQSVNSMLGERLDEPQLPLYLVTVEPDAVAVVFAQIKVGVMSFAGIVREDNLLPGVKVYSALRQCDAYDSWEALIAAWRIDLTDLATGFLNGDVKVDPKNPQTCRYCDLQPFCRIHERIGTTNEIQDDEA